MPEKGLLVDINVKELVGRLERAKRAIGPIGSWVHVMRGLTDSQRQNYLKILDGAYYALKQIQNDISR